VALAAAPFVAPLFEPDSEVRFYHLAVAAISILAVLSHITAVTRFAHVFRALRALEAPPRVEARTETPPVVASGQELPR
jgi:hypothetical protein